MKIIAESLGTVHTLCLVNKNQNKGIEINKKIKIVVEA